MQDAGVCVYCLGLFLRALASSSATPMATPTVAPIAMFLKATQVQLRVRARNLSVFLFLVCLSVVVALCEYILSK